jgi:RNA polymerase primary sigma factor
MAKKDSETSGAERGAVEVADGPLLDLTDAAVKRMIKLAKKRGFVTYAELNAVLPSEEVNSEQIEDILRDAQRNGHQRRRERRARGGEVRGSLRGRRRAEGRRLVEAVQTKAVATRTSEPADRTDDPVRMYLREMGSVELLSREGEIAIAKRIEAGREAMIAGTVREPAHLPGDHHLARRTERQQGSAARHHRSRGDLRRSRTARTRRRST